MHFIIFIILTKKKLAITIQMLREQTNEEHGNISLTNLSDKNEQNTH